MKIETVGPRRSEPEAPPNEPDVVEVTGTDDALASGEANEAKPASNRIGAPNIDARIASFKDVVLGAHELGGS